MNTMIPLSSTSIPFVMSKNESHGAIRIASLSLCLMFVAAVLLLPSCVGQLCSPSNVSSDPKIAAYMKEHRALTKPSDLGGTEILPLGTPVVIERIYKIQCDGFVLFRAEGKAYPNGRSEAISFSYKWGHGGTSPQAPWEKPGDRLKARLGLE
jgi:hypothetical protein